MAIEKRHTKLTISELQIAAIMKMLTTGITSLGGGDRLEKWLTKHCFELKGGFGTYDNVYLDFGDNRALARELIEFLEKEEVGSSSRWIQTKDGTWLLQIHWD